jgi:hypothetical protein
MSPQIRLMIAIRLSWLCKLGFLGKREEYIYMLRNVRRTHNKDKGERDQIYGEFKSTVFKVN